MKAPQICLLVIGFLFSIRPISASDCASCHPAEAKLHKTSHMAHAMEPALQSSFGKNLPEQPLRESGDGYQLSFRRSLSGIEVTARRGSDQATGVIEWVLGAGSQGETPLVRASNGILESRVSYFPGLHQYGITIGQNGGASPNAAAALGRLQSSKDLQGCIGCHSSAITRELEPVIPGVQCGRCHLGAEEHAGGGKKPPLNPGRLAAPEQVRFCGNCHRNKPPVDDQQLENARFQPLRLMKSRCFASGKLACTTCHVAHEDARRGDAAFYNAKCKVCHGGQPGQIGHADARETGNCIGCHMPNVELHPALRFTDHYIRVVQTARAAANAPIEVEPRP